LLQLLLLLPDMVGFSGASPSLSLHAGDITAHAAWVKGGEKRGRARA